MLKLKNLNESFEKLYSVDSSLNESKTLTEAFNPSFPSWLKTALIKTRNRYGIADRQTGSSKFRNYSQSNGEGYKDRRGDYTADYEKTLFFNARKNGFFDVTVHEAEVPSSIKQVAKDPYVPIWGFASGQVYIPGFNDLEKVNGRMFRGLSDPYKYDGKAFENLSGKALIELSVHYAYFDSTELKPEEYADKVASRDQYVRDQQKYFSEHPNEYNIRKNTAAEAPDYDTRYDKRTFDGEGKLGRWTYAKWDKSGYQVNIGKLKERAKKLQGSKVKDKTVKWGEDIQECMRLFRKIMRTQKDVFNLSDNFDSLNQISVNLYRLVDGYRELVSELEKVDKDPYFGRDEDAKLTQQADILKVYDAQRQRTEEYLNLLKEIDTDKDATAVDWLV